jgi:hypothetical protein
MQFPTNAALATALEPGMGVAGDGKRHFAPKLMFDWLDDGLFDDENSDMSAVFVSSDIDREMATTFPDPIEVTDGNVAAQLTIVLEGDLADGTPVWKAFSPYGGYYLGTIANNGPVMYLELEVVTSGGTVSIRQFTGRVNLCMPSKAAGNVTITCYDWASTDLAAPVTLPRWAADSVAQSMGQQDSPDVGSIASTWVIEEILRRGGYFAAPDWHPNVICAWTMSGGGLPSVGTIGIEDPIVTEPTIGPPYNYAFGYGAYNVPTISPAGGVGTVYGPGQFGNTCFLGSAHLGSIGLTRSVTALSGNAHADVPVTVTDYSGANSNLLAMGAWYKVDGTQSTSPSSLVCFVSEARFDYGSSNQYPGLMALLVNQNTGGINLTIRNEGYTQTWSLSSTVATGWHFISAVARFTSTGITIYLYQDNVLLTSGNGGNTNPLGSLTYGFVPTNTNLCQFTAHGPMQYAQMWYQHSTAIGGLIQPALTTAGKKPAVIDQSIGRLWWLPDINGAKSWDTLKDIVSNELGALYADEFGVVYFDSRATIKNRQSIGASVGVYGLDSLFDIAPGSDVATVANVINYTVDRKSAVPYSTVYATQQSDQYQVPPSTTLSYTVTLTDVQSIRLGDVLWHPQAQGAANPVRPTEPGGAGPGGSFTWQDWMNFYSPDFWYNGFTAYEQGSTASGNPPTVATGLDVDAQINGQDARSLQLSLINGNLTETLEFAVNDTTAFLHVGGTIIQDLGSTAGSVQDATSIGIYNQRVLPMPGGDWSQDMGTINVIALSLLADTKQPWASLQDIDIVGDPRLQLQDVMTLQDTSVESIAGDIYGSLVGLKRSISLSDGVKDTITLRTFS